VLPRNPLQINELRGFFLFSRIVASRADISIAPVRVEKVLITLAQPPARAPDLPPLASPVGAASIFPSLFGGGSKTLIQQLKPKRAGLLTRTDDIVFCSAGHGSRINEK